MAEKVRKLQQILFASKQRIVTSKKKKILIPASQNVSTVFIVYHISWKEAMERTHSENGADLDDPAWEVNPKVKLDFVTKESDDIKDDVSQQKHG